MVFDLCLFLGVLGRVDSRVILRPMVFELLRMFGRGRFSRPPPPPPSSQWRVKLQNQLM